MSDISRRTSFLQGYLVKLGCATVITPFGWFWKTMRKFGQDLKKVNKLVKTVMIHVLVHRM